MFSNLKSDFQSIHVVPNNGLQMQQMFIFWNEWFLLLEHPYFTHLNPLH